MLAYIILLALPTMLLAYPIVQCPGGLPSPVELRIQGCNASPCHINQGDEIDFEADLTANENSASLSLQMEFTALGQTIDFPIPPEMSNPCNWLRGTSCPISVGQLITHWGTIPVDTELHGGIPAQIRSRVYNASGSVLSCSIINVVVH